VLKEYRESDLEKRRTEDLLKLIPDSGGFALDVGARDGHFSKLLAERFKVVTALDLEEPNIANPNVRCVKGDATDLLFDDDSFDLVFCAEVLEHIPSKLLLRACSELSRVSNSHLVVGVPYKQDTRVGRTTCYSCGGKNPPWGHVNTFDTDRLERLFPGFSIEKTSFVGKSDATTNFLSTFLMDLAGNLYGTYDQEEPCIYCGNKLMPPNRSYLKKILTRAAFYARNATKPFTRSHAKWIHVLFRKDST